ncbi:MAG: hypothetical protein K8E24_013860 [Methanobacterium paludis]|nr:hypothetical protein [Methanobacterium paludis]
MEVMIIDLHSEVAHVLCANTEKPTRAGSWHLPNDETIVDMLQKLIDRVKPDSICWEEMGTGNKIIRTYKLRREVLDGVKA